jgi:16S rRNA (guanine(1405)-N(7))-methyltransferase
MAGDERLDELVNAVRAGARYRQIDPGLVRRIASQELAKGRSYKEAVKETRNKLHQVGGAYQETAPDYPRLAAELDALPLAEDEALRQFCRRAMLSHASTRERLPYLEDFYTPLRERLGPVRSILDLACGLNPLALPWLPLAPEGQYFACDIYTDMVAFLNRFFTHCGVNGRAEVCDLTANLPAQPVELALLLKTLPCLEQLDRSIGARLLDGLRANVMLVSFPALSLGGHGKGMPQNYAAHFAALIAGRNWQVERWEVKTEVVFLVKKT